MQTSNAARSLAPTRPPWSRSGQISHSWIVARAVFPTGLPLSARCSSDNRFKDALTVRKGELSHRGGDRPARRPNSCLRLPLDARRSASALASAPSRALLPPPEMLVTDRKRGSHRALIRRCSSLFVPRPPASDFSVFVGGEVSARVSPPSGLRRSALLTLLGTWPASFYGGSGQRRLRSAPRSFSRIAV